MEFSIRETGTSQEIALSGTMSFSDNTKLRDLLKAFESGGKTQAVVSLEHLKNIDSAGLGMLLILNDAAREHGVSLSIRGAQDQVKKMLDITEFTSLIRVEP